LEMKIVGGFMMGSVKTVETVLVLMRAFGAHISFYSDYKSEDSNQ
jgi:hypothetical protein